MHIVYTTQDIANSGGTERVLSVKANYLINAGFQVSIITEKQKEKQPFFYFDKKIKIYDLAILNKKDKKRYLNLLNEKLNEIKPDILISLGLSLTLHAAESTYPCPKLLEWHFAKYKAKRFFYKFDQYIIGRALANLNYYKRRRAIKKYDYFITLTNEDRIDWGNINPNTITISNPLTIDVHHYPTLKDKRVIAVGRLVAQKGFDLLIDIWADIAVKHPDWQLSIYGEGKKRHNLQKQINNNNLQDVIKLEGTSTNIDKAYTQASIFAFTSIYEGQGLVLIEAMHSGLPTIAYTCKCGPNEIITDGVDGYLIEMGDKANYVEKLSRLMTDENLRIEMSKQGRVNTNRYKLNQIMQQWINLFENLKAN